MNAPLPESVRKAVQSATLDDKYSLERGRAFMSGIQALVRLPMLQRQRDAAAGLHTAGFVSGYRGSPLGGYDQALWAAKKHLEAHDVVFQPGVNEELAATAVWGTQQLDLYPHSRKFDGVFGIWYGKGPGVDRCSDVFKHANMAGTARLGGVIAVAGDDHVAKSSTAAHQSDHVFKACGLPVFFPSDVQGILDLGLHAFALSRYAGVWAGMKTIQEIVESASSVVLDPERARIVLPEDFTMPAGGVHIRWPDAPLEQEARLFEHKWCAALAYLRANRLNHNVIEGPNGGQGDRFGIIASGKAYNDTRQALVDLGLDDETCRALGIRLHKVNVVWPLEATATREFARGLAEILVVEEKRRVIESQVKEELYHWRADVRPTVLGKFDLPDGQASGGGGGWSLPKPSGQWLLRATADLGPSLIAKAIAARLNKLGVPADIAARMDARLATVAARERELAVARIDTGERIPWFCSGCPHNTSTRVPEGSRAMAGIGCHFMAVWMDRATSTFSQMGGEGVAWVGQAPFTKDAHVFANLGDGTYFHSGLLAIRQAIAAGVNITYKVLYNDAVAMTGGQPVGERRGAAGAAASSGHSVLQIQKSLVAEGVRKLVIVSDEPQKYAGAALEAGVTVHHRDELDRLQRELRQTPGCTALVYDQTCATEKRRRRKRGTMVDPARHVVINELVCEGCGDCNVQSNCLSVEPLETEFGRKRRINQNSCNKDFSCVKGFCPSFVTIEGAEPKRPKKERTPRALAMPPVPEPALPLAERVWGIVVAGVGGTGVITIGQLLGMAAHLEGKGVVTHDSSGLAQKGGSTWAHVQIASRPEALHTTKVDTAQADLVIACDAIVGASRPTLAVMQPGRTFVALNTHGTPTAAIVKNAEWHSPAGRCESVLRDSLGADHVSAFDAEAAAMQLLGDSIYANPLLLGCAWQLGRVPLGHAALMRSIELNGVQVENNQAAFEWGRRCAHHLAAVQALYATRQAIQAAGPPALDEIVARRVDFLTGYQNAAYAARYRAFVDKVRAAEAPLGSAALAEAVARCLFKLMAYKDEYEVARLHTAHEFTGKLASMFEGRPGVDYTIVHHLAPPLLGGRDGAGHLVKRRYGPWMHKAMTVLAKLKGLRGTPLDPFGRSGERRAERALIGEYEAAIGELLSDLRSDNLALAAEIARLPEEIRGYGHVKARHLAAARAKWQGLMQRWRAGVAARPA